MWPSLLGSGWRPRLLVGLACSLLLHGAFIAIALWGRAWLPLATVRAGDPLFVEFPPERPKEPAPSVNPARPAGPLIAAKPVPPALKAEPPRRQPPARKAKPPVPKPPLEVKAPPQALPLPPTPEVKPPVPKPPLPLETRTRALPPPPAPKAPEPESPEPTSVTKALPPPEPEPAEVPRLVPEVALPPQPSPVSREPKAKPVPEPPAAEAEEAEPEDSKVALARPERDFPPTPRVAPESVGPDGGGGLFRRGRGGYEGEPIPLDTPDPQYREYFEKVRRRIQAKWIYPQEAGHRGIGGQLVIEFVIAKTGGLTFVELRRSSGVGVLDLYALNAVRLAQPFPPIPDSVSKGVVGIMGIFTYRIVDSRLLKEFFR